MNKEIQKKPHWAKRGAHRMAKGMFNVAMPPLAGKYHRRYNQRTGLLFFDTLLVLIMIFLIGLISIVKFNDHTVIQPAMSAEIQSNRVIENGEVTNLNIRLKNTGNSRIDKILVQFSVPEGFAYITARYGTIGSDESVYEIIDLANDTSDQWLLPGLAIGDEKEFILSGRFIGREDDFREIKFLITGDAGEEKLYQIVQTQVTIKGHLQVITNIDGQDEFTSGDQISVLASVKNNMDIDMEAGELTLEIPNGFVATSYKPSPNVDANTWTLPLLKPGSVWKVEIKGTCETTQKKYLEFISQIFIKQGEERYFQNESTHSLVVNPRPTADDIYNTPDTKITKLQFAAEAHYFSSTGVQFGYGPLPPKVGEITGYRIFWIVKNNISRNNLTIEAKLPENVRWAGNGSVSFGQPISYNNSTRKIVWQIGVPPSNQNYFTGSFEVTVQPGENDVGKAVTLINNANVIEYSQADKNTIATYPFLTTAVNDAQASGKGKVVK